jgi:hypothetical protein
MASLSELLCVGHNMRSCYAWEASQSPEGPALEPVPSAIPDHFVGQGPLTPDELETTVRRFKKAVIERALGGELTHHLGYLPGGTKPGTPPIIVMARARRPC